MATAAVSRSRISPTRMMSGSCPQDGAQHRREIEPDLRTHMRLVYAIEVVFDRVLDRKDLVRAAVELGERGVERCRLAAAGRPGHKHDPVRLLDHPPQRSDGGLGK